MIDSPDKPSNLVSEKTELKNENPVDNILLKSVKEGTFTTENGEEVRFYSYEVRSLPKWLDNVGELPRGYGYSGGVARGVLLHSIEQFPVPPRDMDVVAISSEDPDLSISGKISAEYMEEEWKHGHGVQVYEEVSDYLSTRDFTLNEVLFIDNKIYFTERALDDLASKIIRPSDFEKGKWKSYEFGRYGISPRLAMKALMLQAEFLRIYGKGDVEDIEDWQWDINGIPPFDMALALEKASQRGAAIPFYLQLLDRRVIAKENLPPGADIDRIKALAYFVRSRMLLNDNYPFEFTNKGLNVDPTTDLIMQEEWERYYDIAEHSTHKIKNLKPRERIIM